MSGNVKGTRKQKTIKDNASTLDGFKFTPELVTALLIAGLYAILLTETGLTGGMFGLGFSVFLLTAFLVFAYLVRKGALKGQRKLGPLIYVFLGLSVFAPAWELLQLVYVIGTADMSMALWPAIIGATNAIVSAFVIAGILHIEKTSLKEIYLQAGDGKIIPAGIVGFLLSLILSIAGAYFIFGGSSIGSDSFAMLTVSVAVFALLGGIFEEVLFRGLLLSRAVRLLGDSQGNIYQSLVFGVFGSVLFYMIIQLVEFIPVIFILCAMTGYYWGRATLKSKSLITPMLLHAGLYMLIILPIVTGSMT